jgi:hypothetical protein
MDIVNNMKLKHETLYWYYGTAWKSLLVAPGGCELVQGLSICSGWNLQEWTASLAIADMVRRELGPELSAYVAR